MARKALKQVKTAIDNNESIEINTNISNVDRSFGALISGYIADNYGEAGLKQSVTVNLKGSAGQSFDLF